MEKLEAAESTLDAQDSEVKKLEMELQVSVSWECLFEIEVTSGIQESLAGTQPTKQQVETGNYEKRTVGKRNC